MPILHQFETTSPGQAKKIGLVVLVIVLIIAVLGFFLVVRPGLALMASGKKLKASFQAVSQAAKSQDLNAMKTQLATTKSDLTDFQNSFQGFAWMKIVPFANNYYADGQRGLIVAQDLLDAGNIAVEAIAPYADVIGFKGGTTGNGAKTAQDRIGFIVATLDKIQPQLSSIGVKLADAQTQVDQIDPNRYPTQFRSTPVRADILEGKTVLDKASTLVNQAKPLLEALPFMLGKDGTRKYLMIFQDDAELRPTGGFMTGYALVNVTNGKISTAESGDIYSLDAKFNKKIPAPAPIAKYNPEVPYWYLRDMNMSPDFKVSMDMFYPNYQTTGEPQVDGIVAMDTQVFIDLLKITGQIGVPGFGNFSADNDPRCNCPNAFYQMQNLVGTETAVTFDTSGNVVSGPSNYGNRKGFLGPVMYSILANVMAAPKTKFPDMFNTAISLIDGKHVQFYYLDPKIQTAVESFNMAGRVTTPPDNEDYLMVVDTNFAGAKTNIWVKDKVDQNVTIGSDGSVSKTLTITYSNPQQGSVQIASGRKLNGLFRDWVRVYVPKGSQITDVQGFETGKAIGEDLGKTMVEGFLTLAPLNIKTLTIKYTLPFKIKSPYKILVQKQGGTKDFIYNFKINGHSQPETVLSADSDLSFGY